MAPIPTYKKKPCLDSAQVLDMVFVNNLAQRRLAKKKLRKKKLEVKDLPNRIKALLSKKQLQSKTNGNINRAPKVPQVYSSSQGIKICFTNVLQHSNIKMEFKAPKLLSFCSKSNRKDISKNACNLKRMSDTINHKKMGKHHREKELSMVLRSKFSDTKLTQSNLVINKSDLISQNHRLKVQPSSSKSRQKVLVQNRMRVHLTRSKNSVVEFMLPIIKATDKISNSIIIESLSELDSWKKILPQGNKTENGVMTRNQSQSLKEKSTDKLVIEKLQSKAVTSPPVKENGIYANNKTSNICNKQSKSKSISYKDFESFHKKYNMNNIKSEYKCVTQDEFERFYKDQMDAKIAKSLRRQPNFMSGSVSRPLKEFEKFELNFYKSCEQKLCKIKSGSFLLKGQNKLNFITHHQRLANILNNHNSKYNNNSKSKNDVCSKQLFVRLTRLGFSNFSGNVGGNRNQFRTEELSKKFSPRACRKFSSNSSAILQSRNMQGIGILSHKSFEDSMVTNFHKNMSESVLNRMATRNLTCRNKKKAEKENRISKNSSSQIKSNLSFDLSELKVFQTSNHGKSSILQDHKCSTKVLNIRPINSGKSRSKCRSESNVSFDLSNSSTKIEFIPHKDSQLSQKRYTAKIMPVCADGIRQTLSYGPTFCHPVSNKSHQYTKKSKHYVAKDLSKSFNRHAELDSPKIRSFKKTDIASHWLFKNVEISSHYNLRAQTGAHLTEIVREKRYSHKRIKRRTSAKMTCARFLRTKPFQHGK
ncbi:uncharacterized protein [Euwallacea similis]|uniref:uncharacterized protein isoform X2 n=1 Tax=Euwallacea similis TaxID=1736056 RepID=UPI00344DAE11